MSDNEISLDEILLSSEEQDKKKRRKNVKDTMFWFRTVVNIIIMTVGASVARFFIPFAALPLEIAKIAFQLKTAAEKKESFLIIAGIVFAGALSLFFLGVFEAIKWGVKLGVVVVANAVFPFILGSILGIAAIVISASFVKSLHEHIKHSELTTPLTKVNTISKGLNAAGFLIASSLIIASALVPPLAPIFMGVMLTAFCGILVMKIVKTVMENRTWKQSTQELLKLECDPYKLLGTSAEELDREFFEPELRDKENKNIFQLGLDELDRVWKSFFGTQEEKKAIKARDLEGFLKDKYVAAIGDPSKDKTLVKQAYDLINSSRGRLKYQEIKSERKTDDYIKKNIPVEKQDPIGYDSDFMRSLIPPEYRTGQGVFGYQRDEHIEHVSLTKALQHRTLLTNQHTG